MGIRNWVKNGVKLQLLCMLVLMQGIIKSPEPNTKAINRERNVGKSKHKIQVSTVPTLQIVFIYFLKSKPKILKIK